MWYIVIYSGGTSLEVTGDRLDIIQRPQIVVYYQDRSFIEVSIPSEILVLSDIITLSLLD